MPDTDLHPPHSEIPSYDEATLCTMEASEIARLMGRRSLLIALWDKQPNTPGYPKLQDDEIKWAIDAMDGNLEFAFEYLIDRLEKIETAAKLQEADPYLYGYVSREWDNIYWEILWLRLRNYGQVVEILVDGGNGSGKSCFGGKTMARCVAMANKRLFWSFSIDLRNSKIIQQDWVLHFLPNFYKTDSGKKKQGAGTILSYNAKVGFTDARLAINGNTMEFRLYGDNADIKTLEGPRPATVWTDEQVPLPWVDGIKDRLLKAAGDSNAHVPEWEELARQKKDNPDLMFPSDRLHDLMLGVHLITFTPKGGFTPCVRAFVNGAKIIRTIEADPELLPRRDEEGNVLGGEIMPKVAWCQSRAAVVYWLHPWDNKYGGNWDGMKEELKKSGTPRQKILWKAYGVAEATTNVVYSAFSRAAHVLPIERLFAEGTWYHIADPCDGTRNWAMSWIKINPQGVSFIVREWPQEGDRIPGIGDPGPWAVPSTGKNHDGDRGSAQDDFKLGFEGVVNEVERIERELGELEVKLHGEKALSVKRDEKGPRIKVFQRIMDSHVANRDTMTHSSSETFIETMARYGLEFDASGHDSGATGGNIKTVEGGAKYVQDLLIYDTEKCEADPTTGRLIFHGQAPKMRVAESCTNHIFMFENWTNGDGGKGACKDFADLVRYYAISRPIHFAPRIQELDETGGW